MTIGADIPDELRVLSTCPGSADFPLETYLERVAIAATTAESAGLHGFLIASDARLVDPWLVAHAVVAATERLTPVVTVQPAHQHPYAAARSVASLSALYRRPVSVALGAGDFRHDLLALDDRASHRARHERLREFGALMRELLTTDGTVDFDGDHYRAHDLSLTPAVPPALRPELFVVGTSEAGRVTAELLGAPRIVPAGIDGATDGGDVCLRAGIIARDTADEAWHVARQRFPLDRDGRLRQRLALRWTDSQWHRDLHRLSRQPRPDASPYWLQPFECRRASCPYLVGEHRTVAAELARYFRMGVRQLLLDVPAGEDDLAHAAEAVRRGWRRGTRRLALTG